jgi:tRNA (uracil-5-)-methyltransferase
VEKIMQPIACAPDNLPAFRNKTEYKISKDPETGKIRVGFVIGRKPEQDFVIVDRDPSIRFISKVSSYIAEKIEKVLDELRDENPDSNLDTYNSVTKRGCFRFLLIKESEAYKECLIKLVANFSSEAEQSKVCEKLKEFGQAFGNDIHDVKIAGLMVENHTGLSSCIPNDPYKETLAFGERDFIYEKVLGVKFKIPCGAFFQVHSKLSETLYENIRTLMQIDENTVMLDICDGTGTMGLILGRDAGEIIFIKSEKASCDTILDNIAMNTAEENFTEWKGKTRVLNKKIEDCIEDLTMEYRGKGLRIVAIVDPPRGGLHPDVVRHIRTFRGLDGLVFLSCEFSQASENLIKLCCEEAKRCRKPPFSPLIIRPVDIFPFPQHYETIIYLKRLYE